MDTYCKIENYPILLILINCIVGYKSIFYKERSNTMKKLTLFIFVPFMLNAMENQPQQQLTQTKPSIANDDQSQSLLTEDQQASADYVSSFRLPTLNLHMTAEQRKLIENIVNFKQFELPKSLFFLGPVSSGCSLVGLLGLISSAFDNGLNYQFSLIGGSLFMSIGTISGAVAGAIAIKAAVDRSKAKNLYKQYLQEGHDLGLETVARSISDVLKRGFKSQPICNLKCQDCMALRTKCSKCCPTDQYCLTQNWEQKICRSCWKTKCKNCSTCKVMRTDAILEYVEDCIKKELTSNGANNHIDIEPFVGYMHALLEKQSDQTQSSDIGLVQIKVQP